VDASAAEAVVQSFIGLKCVNIINPAGSILVVDFDRADAIGTYSAEEPSTPWRSLTVLSPWRLSSATHVLADWNVDGGKGGLILPIMSRLCGTSVVSAHAAGPDWDLIMYFSDGTKITVFSDTLDDRESAWYVLGSDQLSIGFGPCASELPDRPDDAA
jgi:hypothetical protein